MGKRVEAQYICANCEYDFTGFPSGTRPGDGRPLCGRCAGMDEHDGIEKKSSGMVWILYMFFALILLGVTFAWFVLVRDRH